MTTKQRPAKLPISRLTLEKFSISNHQINWFLSICPEKQLFSNYSPGKVFFSLTRWTPEDLYLLLETSEELLCRICLHIFGYECIHYITFNKIETIDFGPLEKYLDPAFCLFFKKVTESVINSQWIYENSVTDFVAPRIINKIQSHNFEPLNFSEINPKSNLAKIKDDYLSLFGSGKDSLLCCKLLELLDVRYGMYHESHTAYGLALLQQKIANQLIDNAMLTGEFHTTWCNDDFFDSPVSDLYQNGNRDHMGKLRAGGEIPGSPGSASIFPTLICFISHKYKYIVSAHERSANIPTIENSDVNHQYAKTVEFADYQSSYI